MRNDLLRRLAALENRAGQKNVGLVLLTYQDGRTEQVPWLVAWDLILNCRENGLIQARPVAENGSNLLQALLDSELVSNLDDYFGDDGDPTY